MVGLYHLNNCPEGARRQVRKTTGGLQELLESRLTGLYLHGSLAMGCFNPARSDIDLLAVVAETMPPRTKKTLAGFLLAFSGAPHPLEISFLRPEDLRPWRHPAGYDLHYSEEWRTRFETDLASGAWTHWGSEPLTDPDLAAHITVLRARGICLAGKPIEKTFPEIPRRDYLSSILSDLEWTQGRVGQDPDYAVLNACRVHAYLREGRVYSKVEGAERALEILPAEFHPAVRSSLEAYQGGPDTEATAVPETAARLLRFVLSQAKAAG